MSSSRRAFYGALGGLGGTLVLTGFRKVLAASGALGTTAPEQVVERLEELGLLDGWSTASGPGRPWVFCAGNRAG